MSSFIKATANLKRFMLEKNQFNVAGYLILADIQDMTKIEEIAGHSFTGKYLILAEMVILEKEEDAVPIMLSGLEFLS